MASGLVQQWVSSGAGRSREPLGEENAQDLGHMGCGGTREWRELKNDLEVSSLGN